VCGVCVHVCMYVAISLSPVLSLVCRCPSRGPEYHTRPGQKSVDKSPTLTSGPHTSLCAARTPSALNHPETFWLHWLAGTF